MTSSGVAAPSGARRLTGLIVPVLCGMVAGLGLPTDPQPLALMAGFAGLGFCLARVGCGSRSVRRGALVGFLFALGYHGVSLAWVRYAFYVDADTFAALALPAVALLAAGMALYGALAGALAGRVVSWGLPLTCAAAWTVAEMLRGWLFTGFPWNLVATVWVDVPAMLGSTYLIGGHGLGFATVLAAAGIGSQLAGGMPRRLRGLVVVACAAPLFGAALWGVRHVDLHPTTDQSDVVLRLVQANIPQKLKWEQSVRRANFAEHVRLSDGPPVTAVIWPETASTFDLIASTGWRDAAIAPLSSGELLITGMPRSDPRPAGGYDLYNSFAVFDAAGAVQAVFDKFHLVPFGEYTPLSDILPLTSLTGEGFASGPGPQTLHVPGLPPFSPLICYEIIFPGAAFDPADRPDWLLNVTNDGWFGDSAGPRQHLAAARLRAAEEGLPVVRVANTGISAVIDPLGRLTASAALNTQAVMDVSLPRPLPARVLPTGTVHLIWWIISLCLLVFLPRFLPHGVSRRVDAPHGAD